MEGTATGRVSRADRDRLSVLTDSGEYTAWLRGAFFETGERPVVGDVVQLTLVPGGDGMIEKILPRKSVLRRADLAGKSEGFAHMAQEQVPPTTAWVAGSMQHIYNVAPSIRSRAAAMMSLASEWRDRHISYRSPRGICNFSRIQYPRSLQFLRPRGAPL